MLYRRFYWFKHQICPTYHFIYIWSHTLVISPPPLHWCLLKHLQIHTRVRTMFVNKNVNTFLNVKNYLSVKKNKLIKMHNHLYEGIWFINVALLQLIRTHHTEWCRFCSIEHCCSNAMVLCARLAALSLILSLFLFTNHQPHGPSCGLPEHSLVSFHRPETCLIKLPLVQSVFLQYLLSRSSKRTTKNILRF